MKNPRWRQVEEIFQGASELAPDQRTAFLDQACESDADLRAEVESLLLCRDAAADFMDRPIVSDAIEAVAAAYRESQTGRMLGPYRVIGEIGHGGMGSVYLAERADEQYRKSVAVKLIRPGVADGSMLLRFQTERQILADLDHPNIAKLLDGGTTLDGNPYIVMDYIEGIPIDAYCDQHQLTVVERLRLFLKVCSAVQYAHQSLVVHRDIKPSNILVTARGIPKLLDFGIAKFLKGDSNHSSASHLTVTGLAMLTPDYASPEQIRSDPITTATDVYSLGVLLYRLLTGIHPYVLAGRNTTEIIRIICEQEPKFPSTVVVHPQTDADTHDPSRPGDTAETIGRARQVSPERLRRHLAGDLDNIVLMALRKESQRRYTSVEQFASDIARHLDGQPVIARPNTFGYKVQKFLVRHRLGVIASGLILLALGAGIVATIRQAHIAAAERDRARAEARKAEQVTAFLQGMFDSVDPRSGGRKITLAEMLDVTARKIDAELRGQPEIEAAVRNSMGLSYLSLGLYDAAEPQLRRALEIRSKPAGRVSSEFAVSLKNLSLLLAVRGDIAGAEPLCLQALTMARKSTGDESREVAAIMNTYAKLLLQKGDMAGAERVHRDALRIRQKLLGERNADVAESLNDLAVVLGTRGEYQEAEQLHERALVIIRELYGPEHPDIAVTLSNLAGIKEALKDYSAAEALFREALVLRRRLLGPEHPDVAWTLYNFGYMLFDERKYAEAAQLSQEVLALRGRVLPDSHPMVSGALHVLGRCLLEQGKPSASLPLLRESLELRKKSLPVKHWLIANSESVLGDCLARMAEYTTAEPLLVDSQQKLEAMLGPRHPRSQEALARVIYLYEKWGRRVKASAYRLKMDSPIPVK